MSPSPQRAGAQCGPLTVVKGLSPCGPVWTLCLGSVCNYLGKVFISPPLSNPLTYIFPSVLLSSLSVFHLSLLSFTFFSPVSVQTPLSKGNTYVGTHMSERSQCICGPLDETFVLCSIPVSFASELRLYLSAHLCSNK